VKGECTALAIGITALVKVGWALLVASPESIKHVDLTGRFVRMTTVRHIRTAIPSRLKVAANGRLRVVTVVIMAS